MAFVGGSFGLAGGCVVLTVTGPLPEGVLTVRLIVVPSGSWIVIVIQGGV